MKPAAASLEKRETVQVKVCGLTRVDEAVACAQAGAAAIGCVFYAKSPRCVTTATARAIRRALPPEVACVGVFVDEPFERIMAIAAHTGFTAVQLHGSESPEVVERLRREGLFVIKALFADRAPGLRRRRRGIRASAFPRGMRTGAASRRERAGLGLEQGRPFRRSPPPDPGRRAHP